VSFVISRAQLPDVDCSTGWVKAGLTGEGNPMLKSAARADVTRGSRARVSRVTAKHHSPDDLCGIGALIGWGRHFPCGDRTLPVAMVAPVATITALWVKPLPSCLGIRLIEIAV
jgi:hypothetical protein